MVQVVLTFHQMALNYGQVGSMHLSYWWSNVRAVMLIIILHIVTAVHS